MTLCWQLAPPPFLTLACRQTDPDSTLVLVPPTRLFVPYVPMFLFLSLRLGTFLLFKVFCKFSFFSFFYKLICFQFHLVDSCVFSFCHCQTG